MSFLNAEWRKLALTNFEVEPSLLFKYLPQGTELDIWNGRCYVSLVGFMFKKVRVLGIPVPFHTEFEEVNLRFYVRHFSEGEWKRGVVFINEFVPKIAIAQVANLLYKEHYKSMPMRHRWEIKAASQEVQYDWKMGGQWHSLKVEAGLEALPLQPGSEAEFITEHYWGYSRHDEHTTIEYQVTHPKWEVYEVKNHEIKADFALNYGEDFRLLNGMKPTSVMLAEGSAITVERRRKI
ncbi:MAG: DUF2071 domain-containing protein [Saprospiraceae bacterium]|nr:DUF2071 domain-containing protein [Saprospiraceae bacterium]MCF8250003.1 DUF2071 domain-containing protein [Saprospiraceae bacterium]MCF8278957.1 DUF2071 domain-containing protein [Bacteroidales bacterium]MCF8311016.1 DUF2071 domain-containing protein [Saprospiraceae bacterium]MCF8439648.1 DUF2071 domain-containing protein [Saprospiraceae bacterium]